MRTIVEGLIDNPEGLKIVRSEDEMGILLSVKVSKTDMGKIIGREGSTSKAIRRIMDGFGFKAKEKVSVKILEPED